MNISCTLEFRVKVKKGKSITFFKTSEIELKYEEERVILEIKVKDKIEVKIKLK